MHYLITAGPTREALDPVRFLSNRSSGRMGFAIAQAAAAAGHRVTLISGPVSLATPAGVDRKNVVSAGDMMQAVSQALEGVDVAIHSAAVADFRPMQTAAQKMKKTGDALTVTFEPTQDILGSMRGPLAFKGLLVGFAAETENIIDNARGKLERKGCDLVVANDVSRSETGFDSPDNEVTLVFRGGEVRPLPRMSKLEIARELVKICGTLSPHPTPLSE